MINHVTLDNELKETTNSIPIFEVSLISLSAHTNESVCSAIAGETPNVTHFLSSCSGIGASHPVLHWNLKRNTGRLAPYRFKVSDIGRNAIAPSNGPLFVVLNSRRHEPPGGVPRGVRPWYCTIAGTNLTFSSPNFTFCSEISEIHSQRWRTTRLSSAPQFRGS